MNDDIVQGLKQFIAATVTQQTSNIRGDIDELDKKLSRKPPDQSN